MKQFKFVLMTLLSLVLFTGCEEDEDDGILTFTDYFSVRITDAERVGSVLVVNFEATNKTDRSYEIEWNSVEATDNQGNTYNSSYLAFANSGFGSWQESTVASGATLKGTFKIKSFDPSNKAGKVNISVNTKLEGVTLDESLLSMNGITFNDNRLLTGGIQTCDRKVSFEVTGCERVGNNLIFDFTMKNNTGQNLSNVEIATNREESSDDLGNQYNNVTLSVGSGAYGSWQEFSVADGGTTRLRAKVKAFDQTNRATTVTIPVYCKADNYIFEDEYFRAINVELTDNRVIGVGVQTNDRMLKYEVKSAKRGDDGYMTAVCQVTNLSTSLTINELEFRGNNSSCNDDLGNDYSNNVYISNASGENQSYWYELKNLVPGETREFAVRIKNFNAGAGKFWLNMGCVSDDYVLDDDVVRFMSITVQ